jgi:hypothetical protein
MSRTVSPSRSKPYGVARVVSIWDLARSSFYAARHRRQHPRVPEKRGPKVLSDGDLITAIRQLLDTPVFAGEGYRKIWARLRYQGIRTSKDRVLRLLRQHQLLSPSFGPLQGLPDPIIDLYNISPDRRWVVAGVPSGDRRPTVAIPLGGGPPRRICSGYCPVIWAPDGKFLYVGIAPASQTSRGKTIAIPIAPGDTLPQLPASGIRDIGTESAIPGSRVIEAWNISPGPDPSVFAYVKTTVHRNLYRISVP